MQQVAPDYKGKYLEDFFLAGIGTYYVPVPDGVPLHEAARRVGVACPTLNAQGTTFNEKPYVRIHRWPCPTLAGSVSAVRKRRAANNEDVNSLVMTKEETAMERQMVAEFLIDTLPAIMKKA